MLLNYLSPTGETGGKYRFVLCQSVHQSFNERVSVCQSAFNQVFYFWIKKCFSTIKVAPFGINCFSKKLEIVM